ncbi:polyhydroxyalkanoic acid system family protein [Sphingomicrobium clamense]|uniref:polyhydroxyalkanoic acid system family protein n=1 Tax=Sphingomicrobium clamense TaxID=2851013 RepID=UPI0031F30571
MDLAHDLGKTEARSRIAGNIGSLEDHIPGGAVDVVERWEGDSLYLDIGAMGQTVAARLDVEETKVHIKVELPGLLGMFAGPIQAMLQSRGDDLLLEDRRKD